MKKNTRVLYQDNRKPRHSNLPVKPNEAYSKHNDLKESVKETTSQVSDEIKYGCLYLISSPIGNLKDITLRAIETIFSVDVLLCEDTRVTSKLIHRYQEVAEHLLELGTKRDVHNYQDLQIPRIKTPRLIPFHDHNEAKLHDEVVTYLESGQIIGLISDAGTPLVSDPGYKLVLECLSKKIKVEAIPGSTAVTTALTLSGFPPDKYLYLGYLPRKSSKRQQLFEEIQNDHFDHLTIVAFESPYRVVATLKDIEKTLGNIEIAVCRELTKLHEEVKRDAVATLIEYYDKKNPKGEIVLVFEIA